MFISLISMNYLFISIARFSIKSLASPLLILKTSLHNSPLSVVLQMSPPHPHHMHLYAICLLQNFIFLWKNFTFYTVKFFILLIFECYFMSLFLCLESHLLLHFFKVYISFGYLYVWTIYIKYIVHLESKASALSFPHG